MVFVCCIDVDLLHANLKYFYFSSYAVSLDTVVNMMKPFEINFGIEMNYKFLSRLFFEIEMLI